MKNIELSYYNFEKKGIKKSKEKDRSSRNKEMISRNKEKEMISRNKVSSNFHSNTNINKHKKSMPMLPLYQCQYKSSKEVPSKGQQPISGKDSNRPSCKSKIKDPLKKISSANNSIDGKNLSRTRSKPNILPVSIENHRKKVNVAIENNYPKNDRIKSANGSLQKAQSTRNMLERRPLE